MTCTHGLAAALAAVLTCGGCILAEDGQCGPGSDPREHACRARMMPASDARVLLPDGGVRRDAGSTSNPCGSGVFVTETVGQISASSGLIEGSCGGRGGEARFSFVAPVSAVYTFSTSGNIDTVLYVRDASGNELACDDDSGDGSGSRVGVRLEQGDSVTIVIDGYSPSTSGSFSLLGCR